ncbi:integrase [Paraburkholderia youngii]
MSLAAARKKRDDAREKLAAGLDPSNVKRLEKRAARLAAANSFEAVARGWMDERKRELHALTDAGRYVFPGARDRKRPMSEATINAALRRLGYDTRTEITGHGFRAMARTNLHEELEQKPEVIEHQLAHTVADSLGTAYNRTKQKWADYLDRLRSGAKVIRIGSGKAAT